MNAQIEWIGPSALNGEPVALLAKVGANGKLDKGSRSLVLGFAVVPVKLVARIIRVDITTAATIDDGGTA